MDAHSKWLDVHIMKSTTSAATIEKPREVFATHGLPRIVVSDNGPQFTSVEFAEFMAKNGIRHTTVSPYHPASNGQVEHSVRTVNEGFEKTEGDSIQSRLSRFLLRYRITLHSTTGVPPAQLLIKRHLLTKLDLQSVSKLMTHLTIFGEFSSIPNLGKTSPLHNIDQTRNDHSSGKSDQYWLGGRGEMWQTVFFLAAVRRSSKRFQNFAECVTSFATDCSSTQCGKPCPGQTDTAEVRTRPLHSTKSSGSGRYGVSPRLPREKGLDARNCHWEDWSCVLQGGAWGRQSCVPHQDHLRVRDHHRTKPQHQRVQRFSPTHLPSHL